jgi:hypothetical protein
MMDHSVFHWIVVLLLIAALFRANELGEVVKRLGEHMDGRGGGKPPTHPFPAIGKIRNFAWLQKF